MKPSALCRSCRWFVLADTPRGAEPHCQRGRYHVTGWPLCPDYEREPGADDER